MNIKILRKNKVIFPTIKNMGKREWGSEKLVALIPRKISLKVLYIKKGKKGGLQFHRRKNECGYLVSGKLLVKFDDGKGNLKSKILKSGQSFHFPPFSIHQEKALTDCFIVEASTPHFNDRVRVEKFYGIKNYSGLPTTKLKNIVLK
jgi:mannose-6-phosphate isomerase-like protein (cupin superfamily)